MPEPRKTIGDLIDELERIREDLFQLQHQLEEMEVIEDDLASVDPHKMAQKLS